MEIVAIIQLILEIIGGATILLNFVAPLTKNKTDDKILNFLKQLLLRVSLNLNDNKLVIDIKKE